MILWLNDQNDTGDRKIMKMIINIHSIIDIITNSSTMIFTWMNDDAIEKAFELLDEILKLGDSTKTAKDLFDIKILYDIDAICENFLEVISSDVEEEELSLKEKEILDEAKRREKEAQKKDC